MTNNPFSLPPQSVISFSGGRTSGYMLRRILDAHDGRMPDDRVVVFCNTGKERPETLDFVERCSQEWGAPIRWLEYRWEPGRNYFAEVDYATASRNGEPFDAVIQARGFLPNSTMRFCTAELKIRTNNRFVRQALGWKNYANAIGLRADEPRRVAKLLAGRTTTTEQTLFGEEKHVERGSSHPPGETPICPLADAGVTVEDVARFWRDSPFDLALPIDAFGRTKGGNCDLCFLKGAATIAELIRENPSSADWWIDAETRIPDRKRSGTGLFRADRPRYAELKMIATEQQTAPGWLWADKGGMSCGDAIDCNCTD